MKYFITLIIFFSVLSTDLHTQTLTPQQILKKIDRNFTAKTQIIESTMIIHTRRGTRTIRARTYSRNRTDAFTEYLYPPREKGTKMLKLGNQLWIYTPKADRILKIAGHMLRQSVMGSDLSYEDLMENDFLAEDYHASIIATEIFSDRSCWILELIAKKKTVAYFKRKIWVDKERFLILKEERYAKSGRLLKTTQIKEVFQIDHRWYPKKIIFKDMLKKGEGTEFVIDKIEFNPPLSAYIFSKAVLKK